MLLIYRHHYQKLIYLGRLIFDNDDDKLRAKKMGIIDLAKKYELNEIVTGDSIFCATGITSGDLVSGIEIQDKEFISETLVTPVSYTHLKLPTIGCV